MEHKLSGAGSYTGIGGASVTGLTPGTYLVRYKAKTNYNAGTDASVTIAAGSVASYTLTISGGGTVTPPSNAASVIVGGAAQTAGKSETTTVADGRTVTTVTLDANKLKKIMDSAGSGATVILPVTGGSDIAAGELTGQMVQDLGTKDDTLVIQTGSVTYTIPASDIDIAAVSAQLGTAVALSDIKVKIQIAEPSADTVKTVSDALNAGGFTLVVPAVEFTITCIHGAETVEVSSFNSYVERTIAIPAGVDSTRITSGIVVDASGTVRHVPTRITSVDGKYYAVINSLTNSTYAVIYNPVDFSDVASHWAKSSINDMGSRMVISGVGNNNFEPDRDITRAEFSAIAVRALGFTPGIGDKTFSDVANTAWYYGYIQTAAANGIITGCSDGSFAPNDKITREQAMTIIARAMKITKLNDSLTSSQSGELLAGFTDASGASAYAISSIASCLQTGVVDGRTATTLCPTGNITRAEVAVIVQRLLQKSNLI